MKDSKYLKRAIALRNEERLSCSCAQAVLAAFSEDFGLSQEQAFALGSGFGGGMRTGSVCGAITGGVMALGLLGKGDPQTIAAFLRNMRALHGGRMDCKELLAIEVKSPGEKKPHCDEMVYQAVALVAEQVEEK